MRNGAIGVSQAGFVIPGAGAGAGAAACAFALALALALQASHDKPMMIEATTPVFFTPSPPSLQQSNAPL
jgi:hypothetical protein